MRYLLDTNVLIEAVGGVVEAIRALQEAAEAEWAGYSAITRIEMFGYPQLTDQEEQALAAVVAEFEEVSVDATIVDKTITLRKAGRIKTPDAIIAATALESQATLITRNADDFKKIENLEIMNPFEVPS